VPNQPSIFEISVTNTDDPGINGKPVYVDLFPREGNLPLDVLESIGTGTINLDTYTTTFDNSGEGYPGGTYKIRAHIDVNNDGIFTTTTDNDFITIVEVTGSGGTVNVNMNGPWGTYFNVAVWNQNTPPLTIGKTIYFALVSVGDFWENYTYGKNDSLIPSGISSIDCWAPDGDYEFLAFIDMNGNMAGTGGPDSGDWVTSEIVNVVNGALPLLIWDATVWDPF
jgi:hypothetical protein